MTTTNDGADMTAMALFRDGLDRDIKTKEATLKAHLEGLRREIDRAMQNLSGGNRVPRNGVAVHRGIEIDQICAVLNEIYDTRNAMNAALDYDAKKNGAA